MTGDTALIFILRYLFPGWEFRRTDEYWEATGTILIRAATIEKLLEGIYAVDPDAVEKVTRLIALKSAGSPDSQAVGKERSNPPVK